MANKKIQVVMYARGGNTIDKDRSATIECKKGDVDFEEGMVIVDVTEALNGAKPFQRAFPIADVYEVIDSDTSASQ